MVGKRGVSRARFCVFLLWTSESESEDSTLATLFEKRGNFIIYRSGRSFRESEFSRRSEINNKRRESAVQIKGRPDGDDESRCERGDHGKAACEQTDEALSEKVLRKASPSGIGRRVPGMRGSRGASFVLDFRVSFVDRVSQPERTIRPRIGSDRAKHRVVVTGAPVTDRDREVISYSLDLRVRESSESESVSGN